MRELRRKKRRGFKPGFHRGTAAKLRWLVRQDLIPRVTVAEIELARKVAEELHAEYEAGTRVEDRSDGSRSHRTFEAWLCLRLHEVREKRKKFLQNVLRKERGEFDAAV